ncbi:MAG: MCE family protein [Phycisphaerales bacterium]|nr:MCE family protein [Phycisphaerales bacterium]
MKRTMRDFIVGLTAILGAAGLIFMLMLFGEMSFGKPPHYPITLQLNTAGGVTKASPVTMNGVRIGNVARLAPADDPRMGALVELAIREGVRVPRDVVVKLERGLVGDTSVELTPRSGDLVAAIEYINEGETLTAQAQGMLDELTSLLGGRLDKVEDAVDSFNRLSTTYTEIGERVKAMLADRDLAEVDSGAQPANIATAVKRLDAALVQANAWLDDEAMREDVRTFAKKGSEAAEGLAGAVEAWEQAAGTLQTQAGAIGEDLGDLSIKVERTAEQMGTVLTEMQFLLAQINSGQGTMGQLVQNPDLFNSLNDAARRLEKALLEAQLLLEKYRKEGIPIQF